MSKKLQIARKIIYLAIFLTPLFFLPLTASSIEFAKLTLLVVLTSVALALYLIDMMTSGQAPFRRNSFYLPILALIIAAILASIFSASPNSSIFGSSLNNSFSLVSLITLAIIFFLAVNLIDDGGKNLKKMVVYSLTLAFLFAALQVLNLFVLKGTVYAVKGFNTVGSLNSLGILAGASLIFFTAKDGSGAGLRRLLSTSLKYLGFVLALFFLIVVNWWPVWTVAFISLLASVIFSKSKKNFVIPLAVITLGIFLMLVNFNFSYIKSGLPIEVAPSYSTSAKITAAAIKEKPLGFGLENFQLAFDKFKPREISNSVFGQLRFSDANAEFFNLIIEGGLLMLAAFVYLLWAVFKESRAKMRQVVSGDGAVVKNQAVFLGLLFAFFLYPINLTLLTLMFAFLTLNVVSTKTHLPDDGQGGQTAPTAIVFESESSYSFLAAPIFIIGTVLILVGIYFTANSLIADIQIARAFKTQDQDKALGLLVAAANRDNKNPRAYRILSQAAVNRASVRVSRGLAKDQSQEDFNSKIQSDVVLATNAATAAANLDSADAQNWSNRGLVFESLIGLLNDADTVAVSMYQEALKRAPNDPGLYFRIGSSQLTVADLLRGALNNPPKGTDIKALNDRIKDNLSKAEDNFKKAINLNNNFGQALFNLAATFDREDKLPEAIQQFQKLQTANPQDPSLIFQLGLLYYRDNQKDKALDSWQRSVLLFPNYSNARWYLSLIHEERGDLENARKQAEEVVRLNPDNDLAKNRLADLKSGKRAIPPGTVLEQKPL